MDKTEIKFTSQGVALFGELIKPKVPKNHKGQHLPAVIVVHGSGENDRTNWNDQTQFFLDMSYAIFRFDKRGGGKSQGDWTQASLEDLAQDVISARKTVARLTDIDPNRIGIWGGSQGFAVGATAAVLHTKFSFAILASGYVGKLWDQDSYRFESQMRRESYPDDEINRFKKIRFLMKNFVKTTAGYDELKKAFQEPGNQKVLHFLTPNGEMFPANHPAVQFWRKNINFDNREYLKQIQIPVLAIWGGKDDGYSGPQI